MPSECLGLHTCGVEGLGRMMGEEDGDGSMYAGRASMTQVRVSQDEK